METMGAVGYFLFDDVRYRLLNVLQILQKTSLRARACPASHATTDYEVFSISLICFENIRYLIIWKLIIHLIVALTIQMKKKIYIESIGTSEY